jgi:voltage-gated potassium channel
VPIYRVIERRLGHQRITEFSRRAGRVLGLLAGVILACALGLLLLDNSTEPTLHKMLLALWNAVNLVTTLGDFSPFDPRQRLFMLGAMMLVMVIGAYAISQLTGILSSADVVAYRENRSMQRTLDGLSGHVVVIGFVSLGQLVAGQLERAGKQVVVIDRDETKATIAADIGYLVIKGDAGLDDDVLKHARIDTASALFVTTEDANRNLSITLMSHTLNARLKIVVTADNARWGELFRRAGASEVIIAEQLLADAMISHLV